MTGVKDYDDTYDDICDEYHESHSEDDGDGDDFDIDTDEYDCLDPFLNAQWKPCVRWAQVRIGEAVIDVSSEGFVKPHGVESVLGEPLATPGIRLSGTPYRTFTVEITSREYKSYYVHDLVYHAFMGKPPDGYVVRHIPEYTTKARTVYSNRLGCLTIAKKYVSELKLGAN